ncbi:MAG: 3-deoxy-manno-octulosonate cytidylyltransferase [Helicobacteraceae bacterium]|jgi:3-deoxy-manno-octulosonate cytidylyltransferase (CMP-KDO synthetase)|nr:3-deoxy-manno-octulosonate cytidylyltransferase [Helicobacteraceae bacterium]
MKTAIVIPARYASTRFPAKPLALIGDKTMIERAWLQASKSSLADRVIVATDDKRIFDEVTRFGGFAMMTSENCANGTERIVEIAKSIGKDYEIFVNVQGDEPFIYPASIDAAIEVLLKEKRAQIATLFCEISACEAANPNAVKIVIAEDSRALYFSRAMIPFNRDGGEVIYRKHIGLYAYRRAALLAYPSLAASPLEAAEKLEQLRYLQAGFAIYARRAAESGIAVDTPSDLARANDFLLGKKSGDPLPNVKLILFDIDGVLSPATLLYDEGGEALKGFSVRDGLAIELWQKLGFKAGVITGRDSPSLRKRLADLKITIAKFGVKDKGAACAEAFREAGVTREETIFVGDDTPDLAAFAACGFSCAVSDAADYIKSRATFALKNIGGRGAIREVVEMILAARGEMNVFTDANRYLEAQKQ